MPLKHIPNDIRIEGAVAYLAVGDRRGSFVGEAIIDAEDAPRVLSRGRWKALYAKKIDSYYVMRLDNDVMESLHRFVMGNPEGLMVDHINHNTMDCRKGNLRCCTHTQNQHNRTGSNRNSSSGVRGVYWHKHRKKWAAQVKAFGTKYHLGYFDNIEDANVAAQEARQRLHGEFAA